MTFKNIYEKVKSKSLINNKHFTYFISVLLAFILAIGTLALYVLVVQLLWNVVAPVLGVAKLSFLQTVALTVLVKVLNSSISVNTKGINNEKNYKY